MIRVLLPVQLAFFESFHTELAPSRLRLLSFPPGPWDPRVFAKCRKSVQWGPISKMNATEICTTITIMDPDVNPHHLRYPQAMPLKGESVEARMIGFHTSIIVRD